MSVRKFFLNHFDFEFKKSYNNEFYFYDLEEN